MIVLGRPLLLRPVRLAQASLSAGERQALVDWILPSLEKARILLEALKQGDPEKLFGPDADRAQTLIDTATPLLPTINDLGERLTGNDPAGWHLLTTTEEDAARTFTSAIDEVYRLYETRVRDVLMERLPAAPQTEIPDRDAQPPDDTIPWWGWALGATGVGVLAAVLLLK